MPVTDVPNHRQTPPSDHNVSIWCDMDPPAAALAAREVYGPDATLAVAWCALSAKMEGRAADGQFWFKVFTLLHSGSLTGGILAALRRSPLVGVDLDISRPRKEGRKVDL
jgi:hypothetical protein